MLSPSDGCVNSRPIGNGNAVGSVILATPSPDELPDPLDHPHNVFRGFTKSSSEAPPLGEWI
jgi:hypothetical protein